jgi:hypothetical protein
MKRFLVIVGLVGALAFAPFVFRSGNAPERPPGVAADSWIPLSDTLGLVLVRQKSEPTPIAPDTLLTTPPVSGYFMMKGPSSDWTRVVIVEPLRGPGAAG